MVKLHFNFSCTAVSVTISLFLFKFPDAIQHYAAMHFNGTLLVNDTMNDPGLAGIFATYPAPWLSIQGGMGDQVIVLSLKQI